jgi:N-carbamoylputrescine amidase
MSKVKVGIVQMSCSKVVDENIKKVDEKIYELAKNGAQIICLQELYKSLYFCDIEDYANFDYAETIPGVTTEKYSVIAKELNVVLVLSLFERAAPGLYYNTTVVIDADGSYLGKYRKNHIPDDPGYYEKFYFSPGDTGYKVFKTKYATIGVLICWDQWYPEAARITALMGAEILFYPTAIGWHLELDEETNKEQFNAWQTIQKSHSVANGVNVVSINRTGIEGNSKFWGGSFITNQYGNVLFQAPHEGEVSHIQELDLTKSEFYRQRWPFLRDRRIDTYEPINRRFIGNDQE